MKEKALSARKKVEMFCKKNRYLLKPFLVLLLIYFLGILAIVIAAVHYADDVARTGFGYAEWSGFSRYLSTFLSHILHADSYLTNIAPLPQILAVIIFAAASLIFICLVSGKEVFQEKWTKWIFRVIAVVPLGLCPYMLECLSYQYDAVYMAVSVLFAILPLVFLKKSRVFYIISTVVSILIVCMTYQASIGIYPMLLIFLAIKEWSEQKKVNWKEIGKIIGISLLTFVLTVLVFQKFLMRPREAYASNTVPGLAELFPNLFKHLGWYFELVFSDFRILWLVLIGLIGISFIVLFIIRSKRNKILAGIVAVISVVLMAVMAYIMYSALDKPIYTTRAMYAIGAFIAVMGVYVVSFKGWQRITVIPVVALSWCFFVFSFSYGNALSEQNSYRNSQVNMVIQDLNEMSIMQNKSEKIIQVDGQIEFSPIIKNMPEEEYRILRRLLNPSFGKQVPWMAYQITNELGDMGLVWNEEAGVDLTEKELPMLKDTVFYSIYGNKEAILVKFKGDELGVKEY